MPAKANLSERIFGRLTVLSENGKDEWGAVLWRCQCQCGRTTIVRGGNLTSGKTVSCGCAHASANRMKNTTHGQSKKPIYAVWRSMRGRCENPKDSEFKNYGGRGIKVCDRWGLFQNFFDDMGPKYSTGLEIDRRNNNGNYEPGNCRWVNRGVQQRNKRTNHLLTISGVTKTIAEWSDESGLKANTILTRIRRGWPKLRLLEIANQPPTPCN